MLPSSQIKLICILTIICAEAKKPPGYIEPPKVPDPNPPKYEYGYAIADGKGDGQGKQEQRDGIYAIGRYYVQGKDSTQNVQYFADDWGYHPVVEYSSVGPHSRVTSHFALGEEAVKQLKNKENNLPPLQGILESGGKLPKPSRVVEPPVQQQQVELNQPQHIILHSQPQEQPVVLSTPASPSISETSGPSQQQELQLQVLHISDVQQDKLESQTVQSVNQIQLQDQSQEIQRTQLPERPETEDIELQQQIQQLQVQQRELENSIQERNRVQGGLQKQTQSVTEGIHPAQFQQDQIEQVYVQQPQVQQRVSIQELQLQPQQVILKHEEPSHKVIFPQEQQVHHENVPQDTNQEQHTKDNVILTNGVNQQSDYIQGQQGFAQPGQQQILVHTNIIHTQPEQSVDQQTSVEERRYETAALFENSDSKLISGQQLTQTNEARTPYYESRLATNGYPNFSSELTSVQNSVDITNQLIEHTNNLVTGEDVLNINKAILKDHNAEITTPSSVSIKYTNSQQTSSDSMTNRFSQSEVSFSSSTTLPTSGPSLNDQPIVVADFDENIVKSTTEHYEIKEGLQEKYYSSTPSTENVASNSIDVTEPSTVLVTPRPISTNFLAPITAGIQLQNIELQAEDRKNSGGLNYDVDIQKSVPYYLGKFEYPSVYEQHVTVNETSNENTNAEIKATENIELGKTLLFFPGPSSSSKAQIRLPTVEVNTPPKVSNYVSLQTVPSATIKDNFVEIDQQQAQGIQHQIAVQHIDQQQIQGYQYQIGGQHVGLASISQIAQKPTEITKIIHKPYPVRVPYEVPYPVVKQVQVPVTVQKIVEKPIHITRYVEKAVPVPQPYPVEKIVDRPVHVPVQITKYIDRPYPVEVRVPYPQPYPVEKVVQRIVKQPYPVEVRVPVPVEKIVEKKVPVPHYIEKPVEKIVEKPVPHYVDRPVPVEVKVPVPQPYLVRVEVPKPYPVEINKGFQHSYGILQVPPLTQVQGYIIPPKVNPLHTVQLQVPQHVYSQSSYPNNYQEQQAQQSQQTQTFFYANPYAYAPQINHYLPPKQEIVLNNGYLPFKPNTNAYLPPKKDCNLQASEADTKHIYYTIKPENYIGLLPPRLSDNQVNVVNKLRTARSNFDEKSVRMEYGFLPPLIPSLEIDEQGNPIEKGEK